MDIETRTEVRSCLLYRPADRSELFRIAPTDQFAAPLSAIAPSLEHTAGRVRNLSTKCNSSVAFRLSSRRGGDRVRMKLSRDRKWLTTKTLRNAPQGRGLTMRRCALSQQPDAAELSSLAVEIRCKMQARWFAVLVRIGHRVWGSTVRAGLRLRRHQVEFALRVTLIGSTDTPGHI